MENMLSTSKKMLKFKWSRGAHAANAERLKHIRELYEFNETIPHGLAYRPVALAYDNVLSLLALSNKQGLLRVYGKPGVEFYAAIISDEEDEQEFITHIEWVPGRGQLITISNNFYIRLWSLDESTLTCIHKCQTFTANHKQVTVCAVLNDENLLLVGTTAGTVYSLHLDNLESAPLIITQESVLGNLQEPDIKNKNHGDVEAILVRSSDASDPNNKRILIGYQRGLLALYDLESSGSVGYYNSGQQLESVSWTTGEGFITSHNDGSYVEWILSDHLKPDAPPITPYGPFPCKAITKVLHTVIDEQDLVIFSGGLPRTVHGKHSISLTIGDHSQALDFTSKVVDFTLIGQLALAILLEEEFIMIDLTSTAWLPLKLPYLSCIHSSAITTCHHYSHIPVELYTKIQDAGLKQHNSKSSAQWPITGGSITEVPAEPSNSNKDILITGHEDGSVRFWDVTSSCMTLLYELHTSKYFSSGDGGEDLDRNEDDADDDEWPPFKKVGLFDPYSDDPRLSIRKLFMCPETGTLVVAGTAGQVLIFHFRPEVGEKSLSTHTINIVEEKDGFVWKGHEKLPPKGGILRLDPGFQPISLIQVTPPASITAVMIQTTWHYVSVGTAHGFTLFDYEANKIILSKCTLSQTELQSQDSALISRRKSFKKSLRESFRRLRRGRSSRGGGATVKHADKEDLRPVERGIDAQIGPKDTSLLSVVRCILIAPASISSSAGPSPTLWVGTGGGIVYIYTIQGATCQLFREYPLRHGAPVMFMSVMDSKGFSSSKPAAENDSNQADTGSNLRILICTEEQYKTLTIPSLKPLYKFKLTAHEGTRARVIRPATFVSSADPVNGAKEVSLLVGTNDGQVAVHSLHDLKRSVIAQAVKPEDKIGISSLVFTSYGEGFYLHSPCEFQRFSISTSKIVRPTCSVEIAPGARPEPREVIPPVQAAAGGQDAAEAVVAEAPAAVSEQPAADEQAAQSSQSNPAECQNNVQQSDSNTNQTVHANGGESLVANGAPGGLANMNNPSLALQQDSALPVSIEPPAGAVNAVNGPSSELQIS